MIFLGDKIISEGVAPKKEIYSTEETVIGTWIDGKPIYRLVIVTNFSYTDSHKNVVMNNYNVDHIIKCYGVDYNNNNGTLYFRGRLNNGYLQALAEYHSGSCTHVIFEYTKTTD